MSNGHFFRVEPDQARVEILGHMFEAQCHVIEPIDERLEMVEIASRNRASLVDDEDVVTEFFCLGQDLCGQHDRSASRSLIPQHVDDRAFENRVHAAREFVEKDYWHVNHEHLRDLNPSTGTATQVLHLCLGHGIETELFDYFGRAAPNCRT